MADSSYLRSIAENAVDGQILVFDATQRRFVLATGNNPSFNFSVQNLNVATTGSDVTGDGSAANPFATPERAAAAIGPFGSGIVHIASGTYDMPVLRGLKGSIVFIGDGGGQAGDTGLNIVQGAVAADPGTGAQVVVGTFVANAFDGMTIEFLSGLAAGQRRTVLETTPTQIIPARDWDDPGAPAAGDLFRITTPAITFENFFQDQAMIQACGSRGVLDPLVTPGILGAPNDPGTPGVIHFVNIHLDGGIGSSLVVVDSAIGLWGCDSLGTSFTIEMQGGILITGSDSSNAHALGLSALLNVVRDAFAGNCYAATVTPPRAAITLVGASLYGQVAMPPSFIDCRNMARCVLIGGQLESIVGSLASLLWLQPDTSPRLRFLGGTVGVEVSQNSNALVSDPTEVDGTADAIRAFEGGKVEIDGACLITSLAGDGVNCSQGGTAYFRGPVTGITAGGVDTRVSAAETQAQAFYAAIDATLVAAIGNGSVITRVT